jgi:hypothetical protein
MSPDPKRRWANFYRRHCVLIGVIAFVSPCVTGLGDEVVEQAKAFFKHYKALNEASDPAVVELFDDRATIQTIGNSGAGDRTQTWSGREYKQQIRMTAPITKEVGGTTTYSDVDYTRVGANVRITATTHSSIHKYPAQISLLAGPSANGKWLILQKVTKWQGDPGPVVRKSDTTITHTKESMRWSRKDFDLPPAVLGGFDKHESARIPAETAPSVSSNRGFFDRLDFLGFNWSSQQSFIYSTPPSTVGENRHTGS